MATPIIHAEKREEVGRRKLQPLREKGLIPAVIYGAKKKTQQITINCREFEKLFEQVGETTLVDIQVGGKSVGNGLINEVQVHPLSRAPLHVDFYLVDMKKEIKVDVELVFKGIAPAVKELGGTLVKMRDYLEVTCLPEHLVGSITVKINSLKTFDDLIRLKDLTLPEGIKPLDDMEMTIAKVEAPRSEEELAALEKEVAEDVGQVEVEKEKKEEEGAEGAEAPKEGAKKEEAPASEKK
jgi:large subunit ribosomal protein L25